jgi:hypothetical protein
VPPRGQFLCRKMNVAELAFSEVRRSVPHYAGTKDGPPMTLMEAGATEPTNPVLIEHGDDLPGEAPDRLLVVGLAWYRDDEVVDSRVDHGLEPLSYHLWRPHDGFPGIFVI